MACERACRDRSSGADATLLLDAEWCLLGHERMYSTHRSVSTTCLGAASRRRGTAETARATASPSHRKRQPSDMRRPGTKSMGRVQRAPGHRARACVESEMFCVSQRTGREVDGAERRRRLARGQVVGGRSDAMTGSKRLQAGFKRDGTVPKRRAARPDERAVLLPLTSGSYQSCRRRRSS